MFASRSATPAVARPMPWDVRATLVATRLLVWVMLAVVAGVGGWWVVHQPMFAIRRITVDGPMERMTLGQYLDQAVPRLQGNYFTLSLQQAQQVFMDLPWVRSVAVERRWPDRLVVRVQEQTPAAIWRSDDDSELVNTQGELFDVSPNDIDSSDLPVLQGDEDSVPTIYAMLQALSPLLDAQRIKVQSLILSPVGTWILKTDDGVTLTLGRGDAAQLSQRLKRYLDTVGQVRARYPRAVESVDLRYPDGYAIRLQGITTVPAPENPQR
ncbi:cell division protein FtsQ/DivIB [Amphibiibacter pelophylacis]|uniref:Cell division protein FtsQ/DivIB n=1 Tax=Amphibiibacter pelophylacis TaxID=1799477 RepID=A0ACC6P5K9_9BURK